MHLHVHTTYYTTYTLHNIKHARVKWHDGTWDGNMVVKCVVVKKKMEEALYIYNYTHILMMYVAVWHVGCVDA